MEVKKSESAQIENRKGTWFLMGIIAVLALLFISFEWAQRDVRIDTSLGVNDPVFIQDMVPLTFPEKKLPPPPAPAAADIIKVIENNNPATEKTDVDTEETGKGVTPVYVPPTIEEELPPEVDIYVTAEVMPMYPGGVKELNKFLSNTIKYPASPQERGISGKVIVQFVVDKDGSITDPVVVRGVDPYLDNEALRVIRLMPKWTPGKQGVKTVRVKYTLPVTFRLQ